MSARRSLLVIDNFDSFVYNLVQYCEELGAEVTVRRNDEVDVATVTDGGFAGVLISPGPGHPRDVPTVLDIIRHCGHIGLPLFGVCLGHQALGEAFGVPVIVAPALRHGRSSVVEHNGHGVFAGMPSPMIAGRYHSLVVDQSALGEEFEVTAWTDGLIMGMRHRHQPLEGVQFHPESVLTQEGYRLVANWLERCGVVGAVERATALNEMAERRRRALPQPTGR